MNIRAFFVFCLLFGVSAIADIDDRYQREINYLIAYVTDSDCVFNRNSVDYKGSEAVNHMERKYDYFRDEIKTTEDFVALSATKSELSGRKYTVKCGEGEVEALGQWLLDALSDYRSQGR